MNTPCRVWHLHQARCLICDWAGEIRGDTPSEAIAAADDARKHRASDEHKAALTALRAS